MPKYSVIIPVYNRIDEVEELLQSLTKQTFKDFEVIIVEDGSTMPCGDVCKKYSHDLKLQYFYKDNEGRSIARNYGIEHSSGEWLIFFDSDCLIPADYFENLERELKQLPPNTQCFGGPDATHSSFSPVQKAIGFAMTSFLTTGGIRGGKVQMEKFVPRSFNMGYTRNVYQRVGGFREMFSEDIDMSTRIRNAGFDCCLIREAYVFHKRRVDFKKFWRQVHVFGRSRITLKLLYPGSLKLVHVLPAMAVVLALIMIILGIVVSLWWFLPLGIYALAILIAATVKSRSMKVGVLAVPAAAVQLIGYGTGFIRAYFTKIVLGKGRDIEEEIALRKGK